jgi:hypothetical protein
MCHLKRDADGRCPARLADLPGIPSRDLVDAWGNPFRYAVVPNAAGQMEPYVWTERTQDGKTTLIGAKVAADGTVVRFGLPEDDD